MTSEEPITTRCSKDDIGSLWGRGGSNLQPRLVLAAMGHGPGPDATVEFYSAPSFSDYRRDAAEELATSIATMVFTLFDGRALVFTGIPRLRF